MMSQEAYAPGPRPNTVLAADGRIVTVPDDWTLLPPGDAALTRRVKAFGPHFLVQEERGRRTFSQGVWAPLESVEQIRKALQSERSTDAYARRRAADVRRREVQQSAYVDTFGDAVERYLAFHAKHAELQQQLVRLITEHATPVGSGTVARTRRIPVEQRAEAAVIAWMRHQTTAYDSLVIPRVKGQRREVRRQLARHSRELLSRYRRGDCPAADCPLQQALLK